MRWLVAGTSRLTLRFAEGLLASGEEVKGLVTLPPGLRPDNAVDGDIFCASHALSYYEVADLDAAAPLLILLKADYLLSTWPRLIGAAGRQIPLRGCIGTHPTPLPHHRGRHPLHWQIALGITNSAFSFFWMTARVDAGPILLQIPYQLTSRGTIGDANEVVEQAAVRGLRQLCDLLRATPDAPGTPQDETQASVWPARTLHDVTLDPRFTREQCDRIVRSFTTPYPCAKLCTYDSTLAITETRPSTHHSGEMPGAILAVSPRSVTLQVADGPLELCTLEAVPVTLLPGQRLFPPTAYMGHQ